MKHDAVGRLSRFMVSIALAMGVGVLAVPAVAAERLNPHAEEILRSMSKFLGGTQSFSVSAEISFELLTQDAQKLQLNSHATVLIERPSRIVATRQGRFADLEMVFDGSKLTLYSKALKGYVQHDLTGTIDHAIRTIENVSGMSLPGADLLFADPYAVLTSGVTSSGYYGTASVGGVKAHHLAFRTPTVDWQIWVKEGDQPLPLKYVITSKWMTGAPQYSVELREWDLAPAISPGRFSFVAPPGVKRLQSLPVDEMGELTVSEEGK